MSTKIKSSTIVDGFYTLGNARMYIGDNMAIMVTEDMPSEQHLQSAFCEIQSDGLFDDQDAEASYVTRNCDGEYITAIVSPRDDDFEFPEEAVESVIDRRRSIKTQKKVHKRQKVKKLDGEAERERVAHEDGIPGGAPVIKPPTDEEKEDDSDVCRRCAHQCEASKKILEQLASNKGLLVHKNSTESVVRYSAESLVTKGLENELRCRASRCHNSLFVLSE